MTSYLKHDIDYSFDLLLQSEYNSGAMTSILWHTNQLRSWEREINCTVLFLDVRSFLIKEYYCDVTDYFCLDGAHVCSQC